MILTRKKKQRLVVQALKNVGMMVARGVPLPRALEYVARTATTILPRRRLYALENISPSPAFFLEKALLMLATDIVEGSKLSKAITRRAALSVEIVDAIAKGEANGTLPQALIALDGNEMGDLSDETEAAIVKLVNGILIIAARLPAEAVVFPSLPEGQVLTPIEPSDKQEVGSDTPMVDHDLDFDAWVRDAHDDIVTAEMKRPNWKVYCKLSGKWAGIMGLPGRILEDCIRRVLVMADIPYWSTDRREGVIRLLTESGLREFRLEYDPSAPRVYLEMRPALVPTLADVKAGRTDAGIALIEVSANGRIKAVEEFLAAGADVNARNKEGHTALILASLNGQIEVVKALLAAGAEVNARDKKGKTALRLALAQGNVDLVKALLAAKADVNGTDEDGSTALTASASNGHIEMVEAILAAGAGVNARGREGQTALMVAASHGQVDVVKALLAAGADVNATEELLSNTALMMAALNGHDKVVEVLLAAGADVNAKAKKDDDSTALLYAMWEGHVGTVSALLAAGANVNARNRKGGTALKLATKSGNQEMVRILKDAGAKDASFWDLFRFRA